ncbi:MAG: flagellar biosynthetic protein FliR [Planctomycetes bacterium]|nr:flagellar biosynthetic protein FliR [Planctomycetota bacterium]
MQSWIALLLPAALIFARTTSFVVVLPLLSSRSVPRLLKAGLACLLTLFIAHLVKVPVFSAQQVRPLSAVLLVAREVLCGLAMGLAARLGFNAIQQGGVIIGRQMGFYLASIVDPSTGQQVQPFGLCLETIFILLFFVAGGHHLLVRLIVRSFQVMPIAGGVDFGLLAAGVLAAGSAMLVFALKLAAPVLAAFLVLALVLGVLARVMPEMNVLLASLPLRVAVGLGIAVMMVPALQSFTEDIAGWLNRLL